MFLGWPRGRKDEAGPISILYLRAHMLIKRSILTFLFIIGFLIINESTIAKCRISTFSIIALGSNEVEEKEFLFLLEHELRDSGFIISNDENQIDAIIHCTIRLATRKSSFPYAGISGPGREAFTTLTVYGKNKEELWHNYIVAKRGSEKSELITLVKSITKSIKRACKKGWK